MADAPVVRRRALVPFCAAALAVAGVFALTTRRRDFSTTTTNLSNLYTCKNGDPGISAAFANGNFEVNDVDWYLLAQNVEAGSYNCARMLFRVHKKMFHQEMLYVGDGDDGSEWFTDGEDYWFNITEKQVGARSGKWKKTRGDSWSSIFLTGTYKGSNWLGWYSCGPAVDVTEKGIAYILKDSPDADDGFYRMIKKKMRKAGVLDYGKYTEVAQHDDCTYTWPTSGL